MPTHARNAVAVSRAAEALVWNATSPLGCRRRSRGTAHGLDVLAGSAALTMPNDRAMLTAVGVLSRGQYELSIDH
jgi:hypothetical protein